MKYAVVARRTFAARFREHIARAGYSYVDLARKAGCTRQNIREFGEGRIPNATVAARLAEALGDPQLLVSAIAARRIRCEMCGRSVIAQTFRRRYCSSACARIGYALGRRAPSEEHLALMEQRDTLADAIDAMCASCEPEGACRTPDCPLRMVSPLPLVQRRVA